MKYQFLTIISCGLLLLAAGCKPKEEPKPEQPNLSGNVARPEWVAPEEYDYTSSMTAVIKVEKLNDQMVNEEMVNEADLIAAFIGDECLGVASPDNGLFYLYIASPNEQMVNEQMVNLRYYSTHFKNLFVAKDAFPFVNDDQQGSYNAPFVPNLVVLTD